MDVPPVDSSGAEGRVLPPETREEMLRAYQQIAASYLREGPDSASSQYLPPIFPPEEKDGLLSNLHACDDGTFIAATRAFLAEHGGARRGPFGARLVFAPSFMNDLEEGLREVDEPTDAAVLSSMAEGFRTALVDYRSQMPSSGTTLEENDEKNLRQLARKFLELTRHLTEMNFYTETRGQGDLLVALTYKTQKILDISQTFAFAQMTLDLLLELTEQFTLVESRYGFQFSELVAPYLEALQKRLETHADVQRASRSNA